MPIVQAESRAQLTTLELDARSAARGRCDIREVVSFSAPYDYCHDRYQAYYGAGIRQFVERQGGALSTVHLARFPHVQRRLRRIRSSYRLGRVPGHGLFFRAVDGLARVLGGPPPLGFHPLVGRYVFRMGDGPERKVCIDASDSGAISSAGLLDWAHIYFKTNFWKARAYPEKVLPLYNGNPLVLPAQDSLRRLRGQPARWDLCCIVRVWGGANEIDGIEHNLRLIESVNRVKCRKFVLAYLVAGDVGDHARRLGAQNIPFTTEPMPLPELWSVAAQSRLNLVRLGMHGCVPWRMTDLLAMGGCPVLDRAPNTTWRPAFVENEHFLSAAVDLLPEGHLSSDAAYEALPDRLEEWIADDARIQSVRERNAAYYDNGVSSQAIGQQICEAVLTFAQSV